jgi:3-methyladenine DNA glycosylase/8-oxoguanine DNA glycosylase
MRCGIGRWADIYLLMALRRPGVWPPGDLALHKALARAEDCGRCVVGRGRGGRAAVAPYRAVARGSCGMPTCQAA